jgi:pyridoxal phosphate enzyme (YggS family)
MIESRLRKIQAEISAAAGSRTVKLIGASKTVSPGRIQEAFDSGLHCFGENRIQEAIPKIQKLPESIEWHFIGHLQSNKVRDAVTHFSWIQSVDSKRLLAKIDQEADKQKKSIVVLIEMNLGGEETKHGALPQDLEGILGSSQNLKNVEVRGLMAIPPFFENPEEVRPYFKQLRNLASKFPQLTELSMGMSHDYIVAVEEGATIVRIGTALFGERGTRV